MSHHAPPPLPFRSQENPFATRWIKPGALPFLFSPGLSTAPLIDRLRAAGWRGEIVGPHGAGKTTLLRALEPALEAAGRELVIVSLHDGQRRLPVELADAAHWNPKTQLIVDGYEQLSRWNRIRLQRRCQRSGCGLLVTAHSPMGLAILVELKPDLATLERVVAALLADAPKTIAPGEIAECYAAHQGNLRETLFALYDRYELRRAAERQS